MQTGPGSSMVVARIGGWLRRGAEQGVAAGYGLTYDAVVSAFPPFQCLLDEVAEYAARSVTDAEAGVPRVLDVAAGIGTLAFRLARAGYAVTAVDPIPHLIDVADAKRRARGVSNVEFQRLDLGRDPLPWPGRFDVAVSLHTIYWHSQPERLLQAMHDALRPGGHAVVVNYARSPRVAATFRDIRRAGGVRPAVQALRWLVPTAVFECLRDYAPHYTESEALTSMLTRADLEVLDIRRSFLAGVSVLAWVRRGR